MNNLTTQRPWIIILIALSAASIFLMSLSGSSRTTSLAQKDASNQHKPSPENAYNFSEITPSGDWLAQPDIDVSQSEDPSVPVVIAGFSSYTGKGPWRKQLMIESVILKNRMPKRVTGIRFGWIIITERANREKRNREAALLQGHSEDFDPELPPHGMKRLKSVNLDFIKSAKPLIKSGFLSGTFFLRIRVNEVHFEDGSIWTESEFLTYRRRYSHVTSSPFPNPNGAALKVGTRSIPGVIRTSFLG